MKMLLQNQQNNLNEIELLGYNDKSNIYLEYSLINLIINDKYQYNLIIMKSK